MHCAPPDRLLPPPSPRPYPNLISRLRDPGETKCASRLGTTRLHWAPSNSGASASPGALNRLRPRPPHAVSRPPSGETGTFELTATRLSACGSVGCSPRFLLSRKNSVGRSPRFFHERTPSDALRASFTKELRRMLSALLSFTASCSSASALLSGGASSASALLSGARRARRRSSRRREGLPLGASRRCGASRSGGHAKAYPFRGAGGMPRRTPLL